MCAVRFLVSVSRACIIFTSGQGAFCIVYNNMHHASWWQGSMQLGMGGSAEARDAPGS